MKDLNLLENVIDELYMAILAKASDMKINEDFSDTAFYHLNSLIKLHNILTTKIIRLSQEK